MADGNAARSGASAQWRFMQLIERARHRADILERSAARQRPGVRDVTLRIAALYREIADQYHEMSLSDPAEQLTLPFTEIRDGDGTG